MYILLLLIIICIGLAICINIFNRDYFILSLCKRIKTIDGSKLEDKLFIIPGNTKFGNNLDIVQFNPEQVFNFCRKNTALAKGKSYLMYFYRTPIYSINTAEDAQTVLQSQNLLTKSIIYELVRPFLGDGLLTSTDRIWHFRRKILTPAFHFNILQSFLEVFKDESKKLIKLLNTKDNQSIALVDIIPDFTLNNVCETALGVNLNDIPGSKEYREAIHNIEVVIVKRLCNPLLYYPFIFWFYKEHKLNKQSLRIAHDFSSKVIQKKREQFQQRKNHANYEFDDIGQKRRNAMLDTLFAAEADGLIDHQGICDEVNTFMFEGYDTTSTCLIFALFNLALHPEIQQRCYEEVKELSDINELSVFDFNKLVYLECVIKETLRLYPSVPYIGRTCVEETIINGMRMPPKTDINIHIYDIMRDERHFPKPLRFDPERFTQENSIKRHPFAFIPFSAGPRNCIGQKFAILEIKSLLVGIIKNFRLMPVTRLDELTFENGLVLRTQQKVYVRFVKRNL